MADRNQLKKAPESEISDEDPFAELTRIMGFDPRVPVTPRQPAAVEKLAALAAEEDDFSIDLEKELMGDLDSLHDEVQAPVPQAAQSGAASGPAAETAEEDTLTEDFDFVFDADLPAAEPDPAIVAAADRALADELRAAFADEPFQPEDEPLQPESDAAAMHAGEIPVDETPVDEEPATAVEAAAEETLADESETAFADEAAAAEAATPLEAEGATPVEAAEDEAPVVDETLAGELETAFAEQAPVEELEASPAVIDAEVSDADLDEAVAAHFDDHLAAGVAEELALADEELTALDEEPAAIEPEAAEAPVELEAAKEPVEPEAAEEPAVAELEPVEELAAAEPERVAEPELVAELEAAAEAEAAAGEPSEPTAEVYDDDAGDIPLIPLGAARDFAGADDMEFDGGSADEPAQPAGDPSAQADEADDYDLEAELSVLLGKGPAAAVAAIPAVETETAGYDEAAPAAVEADDAAPAAVEADDAAPVVAESAEPAELADDGWAVDIDDPLPLVAETAEPETAEVETVETEAVAEPASISLAEIPAGEPVEASDDLQAEAVEQEYDGPELDATAYASAVEAAHREPVAEAPHQDEAPFEDEDDPLSEFVVEQELQAELAALDQDIDFTVDDLDLADEYVASAPAGSDEHSVGGPVHADEPAVEVLAEDEAMPADTNDPIEEEPVAQAAPEPARKAPEPLPAEEEEDPFAALTAMMRGGTSAVASPAEFCAPASMSYQELPRSNAPAASESPQVSTTEYQYQNRSYTSRAPADVPDIETVDVPEAAVALADDLDIPDISFEDDLPLAADFDDFEAELASAFNQQPAATPQPAAEPARDVAREAYRHEHAQYQPVPSESHYAGAAAAVAAAGATAYASAQPAARNEYADTRYGDFDGDDRLAGDHAPEAYRAMDDDDLAYDPELNEDMAVSSYQDAAQRQSSGSRRGLMLAAIVGGVVLIGGIGAYALSGGVDGSGALAVVRADTDPVKVRPENPGGTSVPNQDNKVFQTMNGADTANAPAQEKLISGTEEPVDVTARTEPRGVTPQPPAAEGEEAMEDAPLPVDDEISAIAQDPVAAEIAAAPKGEDRVAPAAEEPAANDETLAVTPRRVRTMVVRADGTLVPSEEPAAAPAQPQGEETSAKALEPADPAKSLKDPIAPESTGSLKPSDAAPAPVAAAKPEDAPAPVAAAKPAGQASEPAMPATGPVAPSRPGDQPVDVVGEVKPQQVAAASGAAAAGAWSMQIASQPSEAAAQSTYQDLARRYGSVIGDKGVNIVKAEIAGKGTFWRVRVPAGSRNDAISLCESYKAAGGNCFVSK